MKKSTVFMRLYGLIGWLLCVSGMGMLQAQDAPESRSSRQASPSRQVFTAETKMFLADWQPLAQKMAQMPGQKGGELLETDEAFADLQRQYGLRLVADARTKSETLMLPVWVTVRSAEALEPALEAAEALGFKVQTKLKTICTGLIPVERLEALADVAGVRQIQVGQRATLYNDRARHATRVDTLQDSLTAVLPGVPSLKGEGVIIGVVDGGIEYAHPNFFDPDDPETLRIRRVWSQRERGGVQPEDYDYGVEFVGQEAILKAAYSKDNETHGTHVAGIAAGTGAGTDYKGVAPKADLAVVPTTLVTEDILDGINYIRKYAAGEGKPCVVNLSIGFQIGPHDGTSAFDRALDEMKAPGFVVVGAAGNDGETPLYIGYGFDPATADTVFYTQQHLFTSARGNSVDIWSTDSAAFSVEILLLETATGRTMARSGFYSAAAADVSDVTLTYNAQNEATVRFIPEYNSVNGKYHLLVRTDISDMHLSATAYMICMAVKSDEPARKSGVQMWAGSGDFVAFEHDSFEPVVAGSLHHQVGEIGGTSNSILTVGSFTTRNNWTNISGREVSHRVILPEGQRSYFSSEGPTADGRLKPQIAAPGAFLISSINSHYTFDRTYLVETVGKDGQTFPFGAMMGTSMATPVVTGIVALCLQVRPDWQVDSVLKYLPYTAINDSVTGAARTEPNHIWGYGKIDAVALLTAALFGVSDLPVEEVRQAVEGRRMLVYPNPNDGHFNVLLPDWGREVCLQVVDRAGRVVYERKVQAGGSPVEMTVPGLESGLYILRAADAAGASDRTVAGGMATKLVIR